MICKRLGSWEEHGYQRAVNEALGTGVAVAHISSGGEKIPL